MPVRSDIGLLFKSVMASILAKRGATIISEGELNEHHRLLGEAMNTPAHQSESMRNEQIKLAFADAVNASDIIKELVIPCV